jgi:hypothetical protein
MLKSRKHVFWEALLITIVVFFLGLLIGIAYEGSRLDRINEYYTISEISLMDILALNDALELSEVDCDNLIASNLDFADRIYEEAKLLENYDASGRITDNMKLAHKKYDLMRTFLWINSIKAHEKCSSNFSTVVYLYEFRTRDLAKKATQSVWSNILFDLKQEKGQEIILIPIAVDSELASLDSLLKNFDIPNYPVVIINNEHVVNDVTSVEDLETYLN